MPRGEVLHPCPQSRISWTRLSMTVRCSAVQTPVQWGLSRTGWGASAHVHSPSRTRPPLSAWEFHTCWGHKQLLSQSPETAAW